MKVGDRIKITCNWGQHDGTKILKNSMGIITEIIQVVHCNIGGKVRGYKIQFDNGVKDWGTGETIKKINEKKKVKK